MDYLQVAPAIFRRAILDAVELGGHFALNLDVKDSYDEYDCYLSEDGKSGFAIQWSDKTLVNVFSTARGRGDELLQIATGQGALQLDCFDGYLTSLYGRHGFSIVRRESNWDENGPDVVFMIREKGT